MFLLFFFELFDANIELPEKPRAKAVGGVARRFANARFLSCLAVLPARHVGVVFGWREKDHFPFRVGGTNHLDVSHVSQNWGISANLHCSWHMCLGRGRDGASLHQNHSVTGSPD